MTKIEIIKRLEKIAEVSATDEYPITVKLNDWDKGDKSRTYLSLVKTGLYSKHYTEKKFGYYDNVAEKYVPEKNDIGGEYAYDFGGNNKIYFPEEAEEAPAEEAPAAEETEETTFGENFAESNEESEIKYHDFRFGLELPELSGSEKQIKWAEDIRFRKMQEVAVSLAKRFDKASVGEKNELIETADKMADFKVENMAGMLKVAFLNKDGTQKMLNQTSAKEIIDERDEWIY